MHQFKTYWPQKYFSVFYDALLHITARMKLEHYFKSYNQLLIVINKLSLRP